MIEGFLRFSIVHRWLILIATLGAAVLGAYNATKLNIDAVPDITAVQVQINAEAEGYSPLEVEQRVTFPLETALAGIAGLVETRSVSRYGIGQVTTIFEDGTDIYFARQQVNERIQESKTDLPEGVDPAMGPIATGLGEVFIWTIEADRGATNPQGQPYTLTDLRTIQDWIVKPQLRTIPGVTEINSIGGYRKQFHVTPDPVKLISLGLTFRDVVESLERNNADAGAGYIESHGEQHLVRAPGRVKTLEGLRQITLGSSRGVSTRIRDIADVHLGKELRTGAATKDGEETVLGTAFMLMGSNTRVVAGRISERMDNVNRSLPRGISAKPVYDRTKLVDKTIRTVRNNLLEGALLVIAVLFLFLGNVRAAVITALVIPLSMLFTVTGMVHSKLSANLMSLGAIDFGIIVDGAVVIVENCSRRLSEEQARLRRTLTREESLDTVLAASQEVRKPMLFGELIIIIVYLPILTLTGVEGKMFFPMAFTVLMALTGALILSFTFVPAAIATFLSGRLAEGDNWLTRKAKDVYRPVVHFGMKYRVSVASIAGALTVFALLGATQMGREFIPRLDEGDMAVHTLRIPGTSLTQAVQMQSAVEKVIMDKFPEVKTTFSRIGTSEIATDPHPPSITENTLILRPQHEWPDPNLPKPELVDRIANELNRLPGSVFEFSQPIRMRFNHMLAGVRSDVAVKIFGDDMDILLAKAQEIETVLQKVPGAADVKIEQITGLPILQVKLNRSEMARYGLNVSDAQEVLQIAVAGKSAGRVFEGDKRFDIMVRLPESLREDVAALKQLPLALPQVAERTEIAAIPQTDSARHFSKSFITLGSVANFDLQHNPNKISRENGKRRVVVTSNVRGSDLGTFVNQAEDQIAKHVKLPAGYWITWGGQFEQMISAAGRLKVVVPIAFLLIFILLFAAFGRTKPAMLVFTGVPLALTGGVAALWLRGMTLSISAGVGFIALSGVAVLNGLVMITFINRLREEGKCLDEAIVEGALTRLRPVLMTALVASLGFLPMALATSTGAEVQRPLATVVIGGLVTSTILTLIVLPGLYKIAHERTQSDQGRCLSDTGG
jgi:cobalt-zinc-cadmium resistance protein CzcA